MLDSVLLIVMLLRTVKAIPLVHYIIKMAKHANTKAATEDKGCNVVASFPGSSQFFNVER